MPPLPPLAFGTAAPSWAWTGFFLLIAAMLALDLGVFQRRPHAVTLREALVWCAVWVALALGFGALIWRGRGGDSAEQYLAAYLVELCLSVDNVFVFILIFAYFRIEPHWQHRVLFWGIIGAVAMRTAFILAGVGVIARFHWVLYLFGAFLVYTGVKFARPKRADDGIDPEKNLAVRVFRRCFPVAPQREGGRFFTRCDGRFAATPLLVVLIVVETTDLAFALDSIPAVLAITKSGFVALTSNIFAILGLRSLYFAVHGVMQLFRFLRIGLAAILVFIGGKMLAEPWIVIPTSASLAVIGCVLAVSVLMSALIKDPSRRE